MKLFISWSGRRSEVVAVALSDWLPLVLPSIDPWMSSVDLRAGSRWSAELSGRLENTEAGLLCVTPDNQQSPWMLFEAGALSKTVNQSVVIPYLVGLSATDLKGPLSQFQAAVSDKHGTRKMVADLALMLRHDDTTAIENAFERHWPKLRRTVNGSVSAESDTPVSSIATNINTADLNDERLAKLIHDLENFHPNPEGIYYIGKTVVRCASFLDDHEIAGEPQEWLDAIGRSIRDDERGAMIDVHSVLQLVRYLKTLAKGG